MNQLTTVPTVQLQRLQLPTEAGAMMQLADRLCLSRSIPTHFQKSGPDVFNVLSICMRFGFDFYSTVWECSLIKGRLFFSGKMTHAMINASGFLAERLTFEYSGENDLRQVVVTGRLVNEHEPRSVTVILKEVRTENENWRKQPDQQLSYAGARIWGRRHVPEVLLGMMFEGEGEIIDVVPNVVNETTDKIQGPQTEPDKVPRDVAEARAHYFATGSIKQPKLEPKTKIEVPETPEHKAPFTMDTPGENDDWIPWLKELSGYLRAAKTSDEIKQWQDENHNSIMILLKVQRRYHSSLMAVIEKESERVAQLEARDDAG